MAKNNTLLTFFIIITLGVGFFWYMREKKAIPIDKNTLIIGTNAEYPPFTFIEHGNIVGFDIDIIKEVVKRIGKKMILKDMAYDMLIPEIQLGRIHLIAAGMTPTSKRAEQVIFTKPYYTGDPLVIISLKKNPPVTSLDDLIGKEVIVNEGYTADYYMAKIKGPLIKRLPAPAQSFMDLKTEKSYAYIAAYNAIKPFLKKYGDDEFNLFTIPQTEETYAFAIAKKYPELLKPIEEALEAMHEDGTIQAIKNKWGLL